MNNTSNKPPVWFWLVSVVALLWNAMGVMFYIQHVTLTPEAIAKMSQEMQTMNAATPAWVTAAFALAVFSGLVASIFILLRKSLSKHLFMFSLVSVATQMSFIFFFSDAIKLIGYSVLIMPSTIILAAVLLVGFSYYADKKHWLS